MTYICFFFVLYWFAPFLKFGPLPSENPRCAPEQAKRSGIELYGVGNIECRVFLLFRVGYVNE